MKSIPLKKILDGKAYEKIMSRKFMTGESFELERIIAAKEMMKECTEKMMVKVDQRISPFIPYFNLDNEEEK